MDEHLLLSLSLTSMQKNISHEYLCLRLALHVWVGEVWEDSAHPHASSHFLKVCSHSSTNCPFSVLNTFFFWAPAPSFSLSRKKILISLWLESLSVWCCPADIWLHGCKQGRVALEQHWFAFAKHRKSGKGLLWLVMAEGQISRAAREGVGSEEWGTK